MSKFCRDVACSVSTMMVGMVIFAGFLLLNTSVVMAQSINVSWGNGTPSQIGNSTYFQGLNSFGTVPIQGMSQEYYNYINNWRNYKNVTTTALETKSANATATSPYVFADEFNTIVGALRGIWNGLTGTIGQPDEEHFFGINGEPTDGVRLDVHGEVQLGNFAGFPSSPQAGEIFFNTSDTHFYYYDGTNWRQLDTPDCASCNQAHEYTCVDDSNPNDDQGTWTGGTTNCNPANYDLNTWYFFDDTPQPVVCALDSEIDDANCRKRQPAQCFPIVHHYETRCVGGVVKWIDDCGLVTNDVADWCSNGAGCHDVVNYSACFVAGTQVTMADGSHKSIEEVQIGEKIRGKSGVNTVVGFHRPKLGRKSLYAFNDGKAFVTAEHPFLTTTGWKALDPKLAKSVHRLNIEIGQLAVGDTLITENGEVKLEKISRKDSILSPLAGLIPSTARSSREVIESRDFAPAETQLYNFLLDGDHTYIADGYVVHNKEGCNNQAASSSGGSGGCNCQDVDQDGSCDYYTYSLPGRTGTCADTNNTPCAFDSECVAILGAGATCNNKTHPMHPQYSTGVGFCCDSNNCYTTPCAKDADCNSGLGNGNGWCDISNPQYTGDYTCPDGEKGCGTGSGWADPYDTDNYKYYSNPSSNDEIFYNSPRNPNVKFAGVCNGTLACGSADE